MSMSTVTADSAPRQPICRFTVSRPPVPLVVSSVGVALVSRCTGLCVFVPCGSLRGSPVVFGVVSCAKRRESRQRGPGDNGGLLAV